jgi:hypothetical protein
MNTFRLKTTSRYDFTTTFPTLEAANNFISKHLGKNKACGMDYNTAIKVGNAWVVTNKYDPRCNDKISPVRAGYQGNMCHG